MPKITNPSEKSVLTLLRSLVPHRSLTPFEAYRLAELQANRLLEHFDVQTIAAPNEIVTDLPRIRVERERGLPVSGAAHWNGRYWVITVSADEHPLRQRFSLMHEFKHIVDHTTKNYLYADRSGISAHEQSERIADYFAACLLMPKRIVKRLWGEGHQDIGKLADMLQVSPAALRYRLDQLGLTVRPARCARPHRPAAVLRVSLAGARR
jgi:Zn-dependent peptidase ImmA (M78 family)